MRAAPAVHYPGTATPALAVICAALATAGWVALVAFSCAGGAPAALGTAFLLIAANAVLTGALAVFHAGQRCRSELAWDGSRWALAKRCLNEPMPRGAPRVALDLQHWVLLQWPRSGRLRSCWTWHAAAAIPERWLLLRAALYFPAPEGDALSP